MNIMTKCGHLDNIVTYQHICDTSADIANIPSDQITLGSTCIVLVGETGGLQVFMADSQKQWQPITILSSEDGGEIPNIFNITNPQNGDILVYNSTIEKWVNEERGIQGNKAMIQNVTFDISEAKQLPVPSWEYGGMYGASGIEYGGTTRSCTRFLPVTPGETITLLTDINSTFVLFQFASNVHSATGVNTIVTAFTDMVNGDTLTLESTTNFVRLQSTLTPAALEGHVSIITEKYQKTFSKAYTVSASDIRQGSVSYINGLPYTNSNRIYTARTYHVETGATVHFVPGTKTAEFIYVTRDMPSVDCYDTGAWQTGETTLTIQRACDLVFVFAVSGHSSAITPEDFDCTLTITTDNFRRTAKTYPSLEAMLSDASIQPGQVVQTLGFKYPGDFGGGLYEAFIPKTATADNCSVFSTVNDLVYVKRLFVNPYVYLESLNVEAVAYSVVNNVLDRIRVRDVRCNAITISDGIVVKDYDLTFGVINYTGSGTAVLVDGIKNHKIKGGSIYAPNAAFGLKVTSTSANAVQNIFEINEITASAVGVGVRPINGRGIMHNHYRINQITSHTAGFSSYIPASTGYYSWEGEELLTLNHVLCTNSNDNGVAVHFQIDPDPVSGVTVDGTITGITFTNLSVENSNIGVKLLCGEMNSEVVDACIKSIYINNMRGRESLDTFMFLTGSGYIRDLYIRPTTPISISQFNFRTSSGENPCFIDAPVMYIYHLYIYGWGLKFLLNKTYVARRKTGAYVVTGDIDFSVFGEPVTSRPSFFFADEFRISESLRGQSVSINLMYFWQESADGIKFLLPGTLNGQTVTVNATYMSPHKTITLTNQNAEAHLYIVEVKPQGRTWNNDVSFIVRDLGAVTNEIVVPYNYDEDDE